VDPSSAYSLNIPQRIIFDRKQAKKGFTEQVKQKLIGKSQQGSVFIEFKKKS
jgi:hypothetical protein